MPNEDVPNEKNNGTGGDGDGGEKTPPTVTERLAMTPEQLGELPEDQRTFSAADIQARDTAVAEEAAEAAATAETDRKTKEANLKASTAERTRVLGNHGEVEKLLRSTDEVDQKAAQAIMLGQVPLDKEGKATMTVEQSQQLKKDWLGGHDVAKHDEQAVIVQQTQNSFLTNAVTAVQKAMPDVGVPSISDAPAWAQIAEDFADNGGLFGYLVTLGQTSRDSDVEKARTEGEAEGHRKALAGLPGRKEIPKGTPASSDGKSIMDFTPRDLMKQGNG